MQGCSQLSALIQATLDYQKIKLYYGRSGHISSETKITWKILLLLSPSLLPPFLFVFLLLSPSSSCCVCMMQMSAVYKASVCSVQT